MTRKPARRRGMDLVVGGKFPDLALPDHTGKIIRLSEINEGKDPLAVIFYRGWW
jgi:peroxiredoxin